jgi:acyl-CoA reductase-like NAD-dependent aldehyde dehydrogenase
MISQSPESTFWNVISGQTRGSQQTRRGTDPRIDQPLWPCPVASTTDLDDAVAAAQTAFRGWADTDIARRQKVLLDLADILCAETELISGIICKETGKSVRDPAASQPGPCLIVVFANLLPEVYGGVGGRALNKLLEVQR